MRAFVLTAPRTYLIDDVPAPQAGPGEAVIDVERVGVCGTDVEFYRGDMPYLQLGHSTYPLRPGHEWAGRVVSIGPGAIALMRTFSPYSCAAALVMWTTAAFEAP